MSTHHGVVAIITDAARSRFVVQRKDAGYRPFPRGLSLFGGAAEPGETPAQTIARELVEELGPAASPLLAAGPTAVFERRPVAGGFVVSLFEIVVDTATLDALAEAPVLEGERAELLDRDALARARFVWGLDEIVAAYLGLR